MNLGRLVLKYLVAKPVNTALNAFMLALGVAVITILILFHRQLEEKISENARGIDLVIGAKGSPLQLIFCNIFHVDLPTGNIKLIEAEKIARSSLVKKAIPLALGDSYRGFRIVGTTQSYPALYKARIESGQMWQQTMDVTIGHSVASTLKMKVGDHFVSTHGLTVEGHAHESAHFVVAGILARSHSVLDNLILTNVESIWEVHEDKTANGSITDVAPASRLVPSVAAGDSTREITSLLVQYRSALGAVQLPRIINASTGLQAASPAFESARLFSILGVGIDIMNGFAVILIFISALSIFIALYNSLKERKFDLAMMRVMGASKKMLLSAILLEGTALTFASAVTGCLLAHAVVAIMPHILPGVAAAGITGLVFYAQEWIILVGSLLLGVLCSLIPALMAYRTDISRVLAESL
ncbi:MAG TPA: FtsX-like permease family protein [Chryseosolibacter sp.]|nr:FtsX-like permease family protein [Chryseosolibacter sp.]